MMLTHEEIQNVSLLRENGDVFWENRISDKGEKFMFYFTNTVTFKTCSSVFRF